MTTMPPLKLHADANITLRAEWLADLAVAVLVDEAMLTPKPGLVDMRGSGAHSDLSWLLMCRSAYALRPALRDMAMAGQIILQPQLLRQRIGVIGREAETTMMAATGGVNTHRGAIWALGLLVTATATQCGVEANIIAAHAGSLARIEDSGAPPRTGNKGERACIAHGVGGARGQAQANFPAVIEQALPMLRLSRARGDTEPQARVNALLAVMVGLDDTCLLARGGRHALLDTQAGARRVLAFGGIATPNGRRAFAVLEKGMRSLHVSPGGAADLLAAALLLDRIEGSLHNDKTNGDNYGKT
jgi:triphosphoribosyl-dephospho-CoA synthase